MKEITYNDIPQVISEINRKLDVLTRKFEISLTDEKSKEQDLLSIKEAANLLNLKVPTLYSKVSKREIPFMKISKRLYFSKKDLLELIRSGQQDSYLNPNSDPSDLLTPRRTIKPL